MSLLELQHVGKRYQHGSLELDALRNVSLQLDRGELVAIWGLRRSGRSTLLRLAAGIEAPDVGTVRFSGHDLAANGINALTDGIAYCHHTFHASSRQNVLGGVITGSLARGETQPAASSYAHEALERVRAQHCAQMKPHELTGAETIRVTIARALVTLPSLLLVDEPTKGIDLLDRDEILALLRSLARDGIAILTSVGESTGLFGADRALSLSGGELHGHVSPELASVVRLPQRATA